jgi:hypothetical protein
VSTISVTWWYTVKEVRGKVSFDSQNDKYTSQLSCDASPEAYLSLRVTVKRIFHLVNENVTNTPHVKLHRIIVKRICHFVSQMILYLGTLLQCTSWCVYYISYLWWYLLVCILCVTWWCVFYISKMMGPSGLSIISVTWRYLVVCLLYQ